MRLAIQEYLLRASSEPGGVLSAGNREMNMVDLLMEL